MSKIYVIQDENEKVIAVSEKRNDLEAALLRLKISNVLKDVNVREEEFYQKLNNIKLVIRVKKLYDWDDDAIEEQSKK